jgi:hypothetical protein
MTRRQWRFEKALERTKPPKYRDPDCERVMRCWNEYWEGGATWRRKDGIWSCVAYSASLSWMKKLSHLEAKLELARRGCEWEWM